MKRLLLLIGLPALTALIVFVASAAYFSDSAQLDVRRRVLDAEAQALRHATRAQLLVNDAASATLALATVLPMADNLGALDGASEQILAGHHAVSALEVARGDETRRWTAASNGFPPQTEGRITLGGALPSLPASQPLSRFEQGRILISLPLHQRDGGDLKRWGQVQSAIGLDRLMRTLALGELLRAGYPVQLLVRNAAGDQVGQIAGSPGELAGARDQLVSLPDGGALILRVGPRGGLSPDPLLYAQLALSAVAALLLAIVAHVVLRVLHRAVPLAAAVAANDPIDGPLPGLRAHRLAGFSPPPPPAPSYSPAAERSPSRSARAPAWLRP